jgi:hypothetical protein
VGSSRARSRLIFGAALAAAPILLTAVAVATAAVPQQRIVQGGFYVSRPACALLVVRVGARTAHVRFGIGKRCESR